ncbi:type III-B CRISPR-associated protein Cas10/Cmr2 [Umezakia ovalisporum]|jgi:CRISPR-associated protein Cmr2|uniref:Type III-B CRISPR-associated protein Cas10/Cmr2 n=1 Tax=Umezakia ovalisporum FSS-43 TaxID=2740520 RepID=A0ABT6K7T5_9CYAN|nr:type III-B CRISPR-associated protein Cas10/Cmr2 [Umezakia ovalisporum]MBI1240931.1 type III-B CRISPR-associated protein Cas10/Cmr2 [Nostoc sp. RI_552]MDH6058080.1 type III-B CRISPR-associated protein Cas10/Cmr2 [Umezakia ovalisporum FSS-43]MDH6066679.1 type III-B CRISPR-associated protein Cas10/Cmr2 [Umezakia ovalisporum APH033B]MDH6071569.1 type III-B CRISPR-associated protein Cas10/Cmr2 [Umezakia ovalisporum CobakiLakeA]MDH6073526.1 type III-B CRISPR-associated protein Cas10/Cmr2 [Umezaki
MNVYHRKIYAFLRAIEKINWLMVDFHYIYDNLACLQPYLPDLQKWWESENAEQAVHISISSDRVSLNDVGTERNEKHIIFCHSISGERQEITVTAFEKSLDISKIAQEEDVEKVFWWFWRYLPELLAAQDARYALLIPTHRILPDCPLHGYQSTVSALTGAIFSDENESDSGNKSPYLLLFTFSPIQEFIKSSRKFLDFWAGSFLLHYFSALLCFEAAKKYGPDTVITPSLWSQEIIDALMIEHFHELPEIQAIFKNPCEHIKIDPVKNFESSHLQSLSTAGFPNVITIVVPNQEKAVALGKHLENTLKDTWLKISSDVRSSVKERVRDLVKNQQELQRTWKIIAKEFIQVMDEQELSQIWNLITDEFVQGKNEAELEQAWLEMGISPDKLVNIKKSRDIKTTLQDFYQGGNWEWNELWNVQIKNTWETYFVAVALGSPEQPLEIEQGNHQLQAWINSQNQIAQPIIDLPSPTEQPIYGKFNVGSWWGSLQARLGNGIQAIKNTRAWQIPVAPGERSTLSGQYSALYPRFNYQKFQNGFGIPSESLRLFWRVMALAYPGLFNGSEKLNAIELTKRMAWKYGGVAQSLGIPLNDDDDYENLIRFPNLCSIAAAHFASHNPAEVERYWQDLEREFQQHPQFQNQESKYREFKKLTRRPFQVKRADESLRRDTNYQKGYNGIMFSSKWLADDMGLEVSETSGLRSIVDTVQKKHFGDSTPADWWVLILGDGDGMGGYVNGRKLKKYEDYIIKDLVDKNHIRDEEAWEELLKNTRKRMGPATHVGLNRALLDFSNRLVPYIAEQRCCGRVIYSGGDDVMVALPLGDLPKFLRSLRAAWCGSQDPEGEFRCMGGYWQWNEKTPKPADIPSRPLFTMGKEATMSLGVVIAHKSVPLPTVLEKLWSAEKDKAKKLLGGSIGNKTISDKDGLCFQIIYGSGNTLEALMKGHLLESWWQLIQAIQNFKQVDFSPILYRLAEELPRHADVTENDKLFRQVAEVVLHSRNQEVPENVKNALLTWLDEWEEWAFCIKQKNKNNQDDALGNSPEDISMLLKFTAFLMSRWQVESNWIVKSDLNISRK